jgi:hypothetical protein
MFVLMIMASAVRLWLGCPRPLQDANRSLHPATHNSLCPHCIACYLGSGLVQNQASSRYHVCITMQAAPAPCPPPHMHTQFHLHGLVLERSLSAPTAGGVQDHPSPLPSMPQQASNRSWHSGHSGSLRTAALPPATLWCFAAACVLVSPPVSHTASTMTRPCICTSAATWVLCIAIRRQHWGRVGTAVAAACVVGSQTGTQECCPSSVAGSHAAAVPVYNH